MSKLNQSILEIYASSSISDWDENDWTTLSIVINNTIDEGFDDPCEMMILIKITDKLWNEWDEINEEKINLAIKLFDILSSVIEMRTGEFYQKVKGGEYKRNRMSVCDNEEDEDENLPF